MQGAPRIAGVWMSACAVACGPAGEAVDTGASSSVRPDAGATTGTSTSVSDASAGGARSAPDSGLTHPAAMGGRSAAAGAPNEPGPAAGSVADAAGTRDDLDAGLAADAGMTTAGAAAPPGTIGGLSPSAWLVENCRDRASTPLGPFTLVYTATGSTCAAQPPFTAWRSAVADGCRTLEARIPRDDANADGLTQSVRILEGGIFCEATGDVQCGDELWQWDALTSGVDAHQTAISNTSCQYRAKGTALTPTPSQVPMLRALCQVEKLNDALSLEPARNNDEACPKTAPFLTPSEASAMGCEQTVNALNLPEHDVDGDKYLFSGGATEHRAGCTVSTVFVCAGQAWTWERQQDETRVTVTVVRGDLPPRQTSQRCRFASRA